MIAFHIYFPFNARSHDEMREMGLRTVTETVRSPKAWEGRWRSGLPVALLKHISDRDWCPAANHTHHIGDIHGQKDSRYSMSDETVLDPDVSWHPLSNLFNLS